MGVAEIRWPKQLGDENSKLKRIVADLALDKTILRDALRKKLVWPVRRREVLRRFQQAYSVSERRTCKTLVIHPLASGFSNFLTRR